MNRFYCIGKDKYAIDIDKIINYCISDKNDTVKETEINEGYDVDEEGMIQLNSKVVRELKATLNPHNLSIRYDLINLLITTLLDMEDCINNENSIPLGVSLAFNTLLEKGFIYKVE